MRLLLLSLLLVSGIAGWAQINVPTTRKAFYGIVEATWCGYCGQNGKPATEDIINQTSPKATYSVLHQSTSSTLYSATAKDIAVAMNVSGQPIFTLNGINLGPYSATIVTDVVDGINTFYNASSADVSAGFDWAVIGNNIYVHTKTTFFNQLTGDYRMAVYVQEDSIWAYQANYGGTPGDIWHNNILRTSMNGSFGEVVATGTTAAGTSIDKNYVMALDPQWDATHLEVFVVIWKDNGNGTYTVMNTNEIGGTLIGYAGLEEEKSMEFSVFPNPSNGQITIDSPENGQLQVFDLNGSLIQEENLIQGQQLVEINAQPGLYILQLISKNGIARKRIELF